jgi:hypothetical protein
LGRVGGAGVIVLPRNVWAIRSVGHSSSPDWWASNRNARDGARRTVCYIAEAKQLDAADILGMREKAAEVSVEILTEAADFRHTLSR